MHLLLCNDDGYKAKGIQVLAKHLKTLGYKITVVAPNGERSAQSHAMTFYQPLRVREVSDRCFAVDGTPADCAALALTQILREDPPDFVVSGINHGLNVGVDVNYSGTVGAATEAALMGIKSIAVSADTENLSEEQLQHIFEQTSKIIGQIIENAFSFDWPSFEVLNVNVPQNAEKVAIADCGGASLYEPHIEEMKPVKGTGMKIYLIGGFSRHMPDDMSQDVSLVSSGFITLSFVKAKQSSTETNKNLENIIGMLNL